MIFIERIQGWIDGHISYLIHRKRKLIVLYGPSCIFIIEPALKCGLSFVLTSLPVGLCPCFILLWRYELALALPFGYDRQVNSALQGLNLTCEQLVFEDWQFFKRLTLPFSFASDAGGRRSVAFVHALVLFIIFTQFSFFVLGILPLWLYDTSLLRKRYSSWCDRHLFDLQPRNNRTWQLGKRNNRRKQALIIDI